MILLSSKRKHCKDKGKERKEKRNESFFKHELFKVGSKNYVGLIFELI